MPRRLRFSLANVLLVTTCIALAIGWWATVGPPKPFDYSKFPPTDSAIRNLPLTISLTEEGGLGGSWYFSVNSAGDGQLTITYPEATQQVKVTPAELDQLRELIIHQQFLSLGDQYGQLVPDGGSRTITISVGEWTTSVRIDFLANWVASRDVEKLREPARALRVWMWVRGWFNHPQATDTRKYDQKVVNLVDAADKKN